MQSCWYPRYGKPDSYVLDRSRPKPTVKHGKDVLIRIHAASLNFIDVFRADGGFKMFEKRRPPSGMGYDLAGVVEQIGTDVHDFRVGDKVWACASEPQSEQGTWSEYIVMPESLIGLKPSNISMVEAASMPMVAGTALASLQLWPTEQLSGQTVLVTSGLSGVGSVGCQLAKNVFGASRVITTVSTNKVAEVDRLMPGVVDQIVDYRKEQLVDVVPHQSVFHLLDTMGEAMALRPLMQKGGHVGTVKALPPSSAMHSTFGYDVGIQFRILLDALFRLAKWRFARAGCEYDYGAQVSSRRDLDFMKQCVEHGQVKPIVGKVIPFELQAIQEACQSVGALKGTPVGKTVIEIVKS